LPLLELDEDELEDDLPLPELADDELEDDLLPLELDDAGPEVAWLLPELDELAALSELLDELAALAELLEELAAVPVLLDEAATVSELPDEVPKPPTPPTEVPGLAELPSEPPELPELGVKLPKLPELGARLPVLPELAVKLPELPEPPPEAPPAVAFEPDPPPHAPVNTTITPKAADPKRSEIILSSTTMSLGDARLGALTPLSRRDDTPRTGARATKKPMSRTRPERAAATTMCGPAVRGYREAPFVASSLADIGTPETLGGGQPPGTETRRIRERAANRNQARSTVGGVSRRRGSRFMMGRGRAEAKRSVPLPAYRPWRRADDSF
jgi:hypothetical protein